ncbi:MAG: dienelactone hydrolase family protein [Planctomycetota bacterium]|nr:dienelactone hydrolase family protein [Planctomycetota bacterium]
MKLQSLLITSTLAVSVACHSASSVERTGDFHPTSVSEEEFKAMHTPPSNVAPKRLGQRVQLGGTSAYLSIPAGQSAPMPGVVVIHEWWGLNESIEHWADRIAAEGYAAIAVDLYGGLVAKDANQASEAMKSVDRERAIATMKSAVKFLENDPRILATRTASVGWCFGGAQSLNLALSEPSLDAAVIYYGRLETDPAKLAAVNAKVLGIFGTRDKSIPITDIMKFEAGLREAGKSVTIEQYDAEHAFANPSSARYDQGSAADAWQKTRAFLKSALTDAR